MNREELIKFREKLETKVCYCDNVGSTSNPFSLYELEKEIDTDGAVKKIEQCFEDIIKYCAVNKIDYDSIAIKLIYGIIVNAEDLSEEGKIKEISKPIKNLITLDIYFWNCFNDTEKFTADPDEVFTIKHSFYVVELDKFTQIIREKGFDLICVDDVENLKERILTKKTVTGHVGIRFGKNKVKKKEYE